jgi:hypothetical protein
MTGIIQRQKYYYNYNQDSEIHDICSLIGWGVLLVVFFIISGVLSITLPLNFDNFIPLDGYYFLINWIPIMLCCIIYLVYFVYLCFVHQYIPFFSENQCMKGDLPIFSVGFSYHFLWIPYMVLAIGIKLIALRDYQIWTFVVGIPTITLLFIITFNLIPFYYNLSNILPLTVSSIFVDAVLSEIAFGLGVLFCTLNLDGYIHMPWSLCFIPFYIPAFILVFVAPIQILPSLFCVDDAFCTDERGTCLYLSIFTAIGFVQTLLFILSLFYWPTILLCGLKLDGVIQTLFIVCMIPFYSFFWIFLSIVGCFLCGLGGYFLLCAIF